MIMYRIGEFSKMVKLTVKALRFYDEAGLLIPAFTDELTGYRYYTTQQMFPLQQIIALRQAGFSIEQIKQVLSGKNIAELLDQKLSELNSEMNEAKQRLLRLTSIKQFFLEEQTMNYQAILKSLPEYIVYYKQFRVKDFSEYGNIIPEIGEAVTKANPTLKCVTPEYCFVEYVDGEYKESDFNVVYAEAVEKAGNEVDGIKFKTLPATEVACVMYKGPYTGLPKAYAYLMQWLETNGYEPADNAREQYIDGCWNKKDESEYLTEVQFPVRKKK